MKSLSVILILFAWFIINVSAQERIIRNIPDIPGYKTLICDFHMHTVFSDGSVWPTVRVDEAWYEGLDAIAITDHLEYLPHKEDIRTNHNRAWQIAKEYSLDKDVLVIPGTEITKGMPPGHFNAIFIKDATPILNTDYEKSIEEAANQGAFIMWNHPGWKAQQPDTMKWWDAHTFLYEKGWLHGIELVNYGTYYPGALTWATEKNLTMLGNSDQHGPFSSIKDRSDHRSSTLVFATSRTEGGIREALFNQRTAVYHKNMLIGKRNLLKPLAVNSFEIISMNNSNKYVIRNMTEIAFELIFQDKVYNDFRKELRVTPGFESVLILDPEIELTDVVMEISNFIIEGGKSLSLDFNELTIYGE